MRESGDKVKEDLRDYQTRCTEKVEASSKQLRDERDKLEDLWKSVRSELSSTHDADIITEKAERKTKLKAAFPEKYEPFSIVIAKASSMTGKLLNLRGCLFDTSSSLPLDHS